MSDPKKLEKSTDPLVWQQWWKELGEESDNDEFVDFSDENDIDYVIESDHNTDSEVDIILNEDGSCEEVDSNLSSDGEEDNNNHYYIGKDNVTKWAITEPSKRKRIPSRNIILHLPGPRGIAKELKHPTDILNLFICDEALNCIVSCTNIYIESISDRFERERDCRFTDIYEIRALIGLLYLIGSLRCSRNNMHQLWDNSRGNGLESCYLTMSEKRFQFLLCCLRFDDVRNRKDRCSEDKFAAIRYFFNILVRNFKQYYIPSEYLTVDEQLLAFRGKCGFRQYIPSKPAKYGLKVFALVDAKTMYTINLEPYVGQQPDGPFRVSNASGDVVLRLVEPVKGTNRNITGDNWFSSVKLAETLLKENKLTYVGTVRQNKKEIPKEFLPSKSKQLYSSLFGFKNELTLVSYCSKKSKAVILLSTMHTGREIDTDTGELRKPEMVSFYNMTKIGVDVLDQMCRHYDVARNTRRWPMVIFYNLVNIAAINALVLYKNNNPEQKIKRDQFLRHLSWNLIEPQIRARSQIPSVRVEIRRRAKLLTGGPINESGRLNQEGQSVLEPEPGSRGRCVQCGRSRNKITRRFCSKCKNRFCPEHLNDVCNECFN